MNLLPTNVPRLRSVGAIHGMAATVILCAALCVAPSALAQSDAVRQARQLENAFSEAAERISPSVVTIKVAAASRGRRRGGVQRGSGSGVIVSPDGAVLTNHHVIEGAVRIDVVVRGGRSYRAQVVGTDPATDLAVLRIAAKGLKAARFADSSKARVGQWVVALGSPFELDYTLTAGIISAVGRGGLGRTEIEDYLQTDASINPGNSGGPLVDLDGHVLGINTMIVGPRSAGIGFAVPSNMAKRVFEDLLSAGRVDRPWIGVTFQELTERLARSLGADSPRGALINDVTSGGPAARAGVRPGDIVRKLDGQPIGHGRDLLRAVLRSRVGATVKLRILREGKPITLKLTTAERPVKRSARRGASPPAKGKPDGGLGFTVERLTARAARRMGYPGHGEVVVVDVDPGGVAWRAGMRRRDVITRADRKRVRKPADLQAALRDGHALLRVERPGGSFYIALGAR